jgi:tRNA A22 N-methylase
LECIVIVAVIDGMGGGIGAQIVTQLRQELPPEIEILALGPTSSPDALR